jgi:predicted ATPase
LTTGRSQCIRGLMITRVQVKNFRSIAKADVQLGPLTVLVGRHGAGKSAFLDVLRFVRDALRSGLENAILDRHGVTSIRRCAPSKPYNVEICLTVSDEAIFGEYCFVITSGQNGSYRVAREACRVGRGVAEEQFETRDGKWRIAPGVELYLHQQRIIMGERRLDSGFEPSALVLPTLSAFSKFYSRLRRALDGNFYNIFPSMLREPQRPSNDQLLTEGGESFASVVRGMRRKRTAFRDLLATLRHVVDGVSDLRVREVGGYLVTELRHDDIGPGVGRGKHPWFELAQESDGTLRILGILVALYQENLPGRSIVIGLEEPENALHPGALAVLSEVIRESALRNQILITTQSPDLISTFGVDELRAVERIDGQTHIAPIQESQRQAIEEQLFSGGDLLRIEGLHGEESSFVEHPGG